MGTKSNTTSSVININGGNNSTFQEREKILLVQAHEAGQVLDEEELAFLADSGVVESQDTQTIITHNAAFQTDDLDAFNLDCDEAPGAKATLMAYLSIYDSYIIFEVTISDTTQDNSVIDNCAQEMYYYEQPAFDLASDIEITSDSNIISYDQYLKETESAVVQYTTSIEQQNAEIMSVFDEITHRVAKCNAESIKNKNEQESLTAKLERYKEMVRIFKERQKVDLNDHEKYIDSQMNDMILNKNAKFAAFQKEINTLKFIRSIHVKENESLMTTIDKAQRIKPTLYDGVVISKKHDVISVVDYEETLILADDVEVAKTSQEVLQSPRQCT
ncbi:hypothetical protein Tco_1232775 [Tanacetum coccineum]